MNFAHFAIAGGVPFGIEDPDGYTRQRNTHSAGTALPHVRITQVHERFAHAVALQNRVTEKHAKIFQHLRRQRS